jgi:hypothetical protein
LFDPTKLLFVKFNDSEFFFPWAPLLIGALWGYLISTVPLGRFLRRASILFSWLDLALALTAVAAGIWLHSWATAAVACLLPTFIRGLFMVLVLRHSPRLPARVSFRLYAEHIAEQIEENGLAEREMQSMLMSLMSFAVVAFNVSPIFSALAFGYAIFSCVNAIFSCLARTAISREH